MCISSQQHTGMQVWWVTRISMSWARTPVCGQDGTGRSLHSKPWVSGRQGLRSNEKALLWSLSSMMHQYHMVVKAVCFMSMLYHRL